MKTILLCHAIAVGMSSNGWLDVKQHCYSANSRAHYHYALPAVFAPEIAYTPLTKCLTKPTPKGCQYP